MMPRLFGRRRLEQSFAMSSAMLVILVLGTITIVVHERVEHVFG